MAQKPELQKYSVLREGTQFGAVTSVELTESQAEAFLRAGDIGPFDPSRKPARSKTAARGRRVTSGGGDTRALEEALARADKAEADLKNAVSPDQLKAAQDAKAAVEEEVQKLQASVAEYQAETASLSERLTEAETQHDACVAQLTEAQELLNEAVLETESLERIIARIEAVQPDLVTQAKEAVAAEYQAAAAETAAQPQG